MNVIMVTGGAGFIGSNFIRYVLEKTDFKGKIVNVDKLTYAGNPENLSDIAQKYSSTRYFFEQTDICDKEKIAELFKKYNIDTVVHFAAESHVDRSILGPKDFIETNIMGTFNLLENARNYWGQRTDVRFHHISTDEVYGSLGETGYFYETTPYDPRSPYSASKASSDHLVEAYKHTYGLPVTKSNCSNNYGPYHFPEKLIPLLILNILDQKPLPVYGDGLNVRDWLYVEDHCAAINLILEKGKVGEVYNLGGHNEKANIEIVKIILSELGKPESLITYVAGRKGHAQRYAIDPSKAMAELGWAPTTMFKDGIKLTIQWYKDHMDWMAECTSGEYMKYYEEIYGNR